MFVHLSQHANYFKFRLSSHATLSVTESSWKTRNREILAQI